MKKTVMALLLLLSSLTACARQVYGNGLSCEELMQRAMGNDVQEMDFAAYGEDQIQYFFADTDLAIDYRLLYSVPSENIDEVGILKAADEKSAKELLRIAEAYLQEMQQEDAAFIASYAPEELPKLTNAQAVRFGSYVIYAILPEENRQAFLQAVEEALRIDA